jgi:hypothetical protein
VQVPGDPRVTDGQILDGSLVVAMENRTLRAARWAFRGGLLADDRGVQDVFVPVKLLEFQVRDSGGEKWRDYVCESHSSSDRSLVRLARKAANNHKSVAIP